MEIKAKAERSVLGARGRRVQLAVCPHCGGNVRRVRDIYGTYRQCLQCSREVMAEAAPAMDAALTTPEREELLVA